MPQRHVLLRLYLHRADITRWDVHCRIHEYHHVSRRQLLR